MPTKRKEPQSTNETIQLLLKEPEKWAQHIAAEPEAQHLTIAQALLADENDLAREPMKWAFQQILHSDLETRYELVIERMASLPRGWQRALVIEWCGPLLDGPAHPLVEPLLQLFEADDPTQKHFDAEQHPSNVMENVAHAIAPFAHEPLIFDRIIAFLEQNTGEAARKEIVQNLFNPFEEASHIIPRLGDTQASRVAKVMIKLNLSSNIQVHNVAGHQLYRFRHVGAEGTITEALDEYGAQCTENAPKHVIDLMANLYASLRSMGTPTSRTSLVKRLWKERRCYWRLGNAIGEIFSAQVQGEVMALLDETRDIPAAAAYMASLVKFVDKNNPVTALSQALVNWDIPTDAVEKSQLKYTLLEGCRVGLIDKKNQLVRACWERAQAIDEAPYSPYHTIDRDSPYEDPFADEDERQKLEFVLSGEADAETKALRESANKARTKGKPNARISDEELGLLAEATVDARIFTNKKTKELWFFDTNQEPHYFDGFDVVTPPFTFHTDIGKDAKQFLAGLNITDRAMFWDAKAANFQEYVQWGPRLMIYRGTNNGAFRVFGIACDQEEEANALLQDIRDNPTKGFAETDPYYIAGKGAIVRTFYRPKPDGSWNKEGRTLEAVCNAQWQWEGTKFASDAEAIAALQEYEAKTLRDDKGQVTCIEWMERIRRAEDMPLEEWLSDRAREDKEDAAWHLRALEAIYTYLDQHALLPLFQHFQIHLDTATKQDEITAYQTELDQPLHPKLRGLWDEIGAAFWQVGTQSQRILSPTEVLKARPAARAFGAALAPKGKKKAPPVLDKLDFLALDQDEQPVILYADFPINDDRRFTTPPDRGHDFWWEISLGWVLATSFLSDFLQTLHTAAPQTRMLWYGQAWHSGITTTRYEQAGKYWEIMLDAKGARYATRSGKIGADGKVTYKQFNSPEKTQKAADKIMASKQKSGYKVTRT